MIIFLSLNLFINKVNFEETGELNQEEIDFQKEENKIQEDENGKNENQEEYDWYIEISSIKLKAPIKETTEMEVLNNYVGHFEETPLLNGNVGLAGHNRGYEKNYFEDLNQIKKGEVIKYKYYDFEKTYIVDQIEIIKNTDWSYLENTEENKITLITCIENKPDYRLCIQGTEK